VLSSNYPLYGDMSSRVMSILKQFTPDVEVYSIDESFLEFKDFKKGFDYNDYGNKIRRRIKKWTGIPTCVGIAPTKALSKVANKVAEDVWGIGRGLTKRLKLKGCKTAFDFTELSDTWVKSNFSVTESKLKRDLEGIPTLQLDEVKNKRAIATTRSFDYTYDDINYIKERVSTFATSCAEKLRKQGSSCYVIIVMLSSDRHKKDLKQHRASTSVNLSYATNSSLIISDCAVKAVMSIFKQGIKYKRAGVIVTGLVPTDNYQL